MDPETENIEDIEDIAADGIQNGKRNDEGDGVNVRRRKPKEEQVETHRLQALENSSFVPGTHKIFVKTWGCAHNSSDSEYMSGILAMSGYPLVQDQEDADLWLLNSCTVKNPAEDHFKNFISRGLGSGKKVVVSGCVPQGKPQSDYLKDLSVVGVQQIDRVVEVVEETLKGHTVRLFGQKRTGEGRKAGGASLDLPKVRKNPLVEIIAINTGCLNQCTYCKTKHARGELGSYPIHEIVERARNSFAEGVVEIWLTSEDTGAYGRDIDVTLPDLLSELVEVIPEGCRLRLGMTNPPYILDHLEEIAKILRHPRVYSFLHVPVQSGSDAVLRDMRREYNVDDFSRVVNILRKKVPGITIATDIIAGFPTETEDDFKETMILCRKYRFPSLFINQFYPRPGTPAAKMKRVPTQEVKRRTRQLSEFFQSYKPYADRIGIRYQVLVTEVSHDKKHYVGHNRFYEQVLVPMDPSIMGKLCEIEVISSGKFHMTGRLVGDEPLSPNISDPLKQGQVSSSSASTKSEGSQQSSWIYQLSVVILGLAIFVRLVQLIFLANTTKTRPHA